MMKMLRALHNVEKLTVSASFVQRRITDVDDDWEARLSLPCTLSHLKFVKIKSLQGCDNEFKFVEFRWKNGVVLEEMVLWFSDFPRKFSSPEQADIAKKFSKKLRAVPRAS
ncbi:hypothetical protein C5167_012110 [Papaver somniferum]|uniref:FBD domain-containing protein n=1 Tax=Papaver somniferum TaxID=3469 RepID=A0A4Y7IWI4_PAPSO|nr:hypothetical protein C5167_012110 [Papaver somniferum]